MDLEDELRKVQRAENIRYRNQWIKDFKATSLYASRQPNQL